MFLFYLSRLMMHVQIPIFNILFFGVKRYIKGVNNQKKRDAVHTKCQGANLKYFSSNILNLFLVSQKLNVLHRQIIHGPISDTSQASNL